MRTFFYDLHGLVRVRLDLTEGGRWRGRVLDQKLSSFCAEAGPADVRMHVGPFDPEIPDGARVIDKDFFVAPGYVYFRGGGSGGATEIVGLDAPATVIRHRPYPEGLARRIGRGLRGINMYLEPVIAWHLRRRGAWLCHAAAVAKGERALVLFGTNGAHKTQVALDLCLRRSWKLLGDDLIVLHDGRALGFIEHPAVLHARARAVLASGRARACPLRVGLDVLRGSPRRCEALGLATQAPVAAAALLERTTPEAPPSIAPEDPRRIWACALALERLELNKHQRRHRQVTNFGRFLMAYEYAFPGSAIFRQMLLETATIPAWMDVPAVGCVLGERCDADFAERLERHLDQRRWSRP